MPVKKSEKTKKEERAKEVSRKQAIKARAEASARKIKNEMKKSINTAIVAAFGFIIALSWRDLITEYINRLTSISPLGGKWMHALIVTFVGVVGIVLVTRFLKVSDE